MGAWSLLLQYISLCPGAQLSLHVRDSDPIFSANEICRLLCVESGRRDFIGGDDLTQRALVDYWLEWEGREVKVGVAFGILEPLNKGDWPFCLMLLSGCPLLGS